MSNWTHAPERTNEKVTAKGQDWTILHAQVAAGTWDILLQNADGELGRYYGYKRTIAKNSNLTQRSAETYVRIF